jgi:deaminated glutathione amidase
MEPLRAAAVQLTSTHDVEGNLSRAAALVAEAAARGARLVGLPENFAFIGEEADKLALAESLDGAPGRILGAMAGAARKHGVWLLLGGMPERSNDPRRVHNACVLLRPDGTVAARYRKVHLFDVNLADGAVFQESASVAAGADLVVADTPWGGLGLSVCYDLRFPELYRGLVARGARMLSVPAAFTLYTGKDHWHVLLRARAVENLCWVLAPAQTGRHNERRQSYGHACIVDPWGAVVADAGDREGLAVADLDFLAQDRIRRELPALDHRRL